MATPSQKSAELARHQALYRETRMKNNDLLPRGVPCHVGLIPDGIRRWSQRNHTTLHEAYDKAMIKIRDTINRVFIEGSKEMTVYLLSRDNLKRRRSELEPVFQTETALMRELLPPVAKDWSSRIQVIGSVRELPESMRLEIKHLTKRTERLREKTLNLLLAYDPLLDVEDVILRAHRCLLSGEPWHGVRIDRTADSPEKSDEPGKLALRPNKLDLVIRTGRMRRLSNFLPLQSAYAELFFLDKLLPDISSSDLAKAFRFYRDQDRRFGK